MISVLETNLKIDTNTQSFMTYLVLVSVKPERGRDHTAGQTRTLSKTLLTFELVSVKRERGRDHPAGQTLSKTLLTFGLVPVK